jgi:hypothetical protein
MGTGYNWVWQQQGAAQLGTTQLRVRLQMGTGYNRVRQQQGAATTGYWLQQGAAQHGTTVVWYPGVPHPVVAVPSCSEYPVADATAVVWYTFV